MKKSFKVSVDLPEGCTIKMMEEYIRGAVKADCGMLPITEPLHHLNRDSVKVYPLQVNK